MTKKNFTRITPFLFFAPTLFADDAVLNYLKSLKAADVSQKTPYSLRVSLTHAANGMFPDQGLTSTLCDITEGTLGLAARCTVENLPHPTYQRVDTFNYQSIDFDPDGNLVVWMRNKWLILRTLHNNETYEEQRSSFVSPAGIVVRSGTGRILHRYTPTDQNGWALSSLRRVWWALGYGLSADFISVEDDKVRSPQLRQLRVRGSLDGFPGGVWETVLENEHSPFVRKALFVRDSDRVPIVEINTEGARRFDGITIAERGSVTFLGDRDNDRTIRTDIVLRDFKNHFDDQLFASVSLHFTNLDEELDIIDYRNNPSQPTRVRMHSPVLVP